MNISKKVIIKLLKRKVRKTKRKRNKIKENKIKGSGDFRNISKKEDCYTPLTNENFRYDENTNYTDFGNLQFNEFRLLKQRGSYNEVYNVAGKNICDDYDNNIVLRLSQRGFNLKDEKDKERIEEHKSEMKLQAKLNEIMPTLYMCGTIKIPNRSYELYYTFSIMKHYDETLLNILISLNDNFHDERENIIILLEKSLFLYKKIADMELCNIDVKPNNIVCNWSIFTDDNFKELGVENNTNIAIIDMEPYYIFEYNSIENRNEIYFMIMAYIFLNITKNIKVTKEIKIGESVEEEETFIFSNEVIKIVDQFLMDKIYNNSFYEQFENIVNNNKQIKERFDNYGIEPPTKP